MPWQGLFMLALLTGMLVFGLVGYWRGKGIHKGIHSCCEPKPSTKSKVLGG